jgi:hypothetical protein
MVAGVEFIDENGGGLALGSVPGIVVRAESRGKRREPCQQTRADRLADRLNALKGTSPRATSGTRAPGRHREFIVASAESSLSPAGATTDRTISTTILFQWPPVSLLRKQLLRVSAARSTLLP